MGARWTAEERATLLRVARAHTCSGQVDWQEVMRALQQLRGWNRTLSTCRVHYFSLMKGHVKRDGNDHIISMYRNAGVHCN